MLEQGLLSEADLDAIDRRSAETIADAVRFAQDDPFPSPAELLTDVYVSFPASELWPFQKPPVLARAPA